MIYKHIQKAPRVTPVVLARADILCLRGQSTRKQVAYKGTGSAEGQL
jgi:hypothetical protein